MLLSSLSSLELIHLEMQRQHADAVLSLEQNQDITKAIADSIRDSKHTLLLGMGASHYANRVAETALRAVGIQAFAVPLSEALYAPLPQSSQAVIIVSQSGESGEAIRYLELFGANNTFAMTLEPNSKLAQAVPSCIGAGGIEKGFAATRSLLLTLTLHGAVLEALDYPQTGLRSVLQAPIELPVAAAIMKLSNCKSLIFSGRAELQGIAEVSALHTAELARVPALALEGGQFRHGPLELLEPGLGVVLFRAAGSSAILTQSLVSTCLSANVPIIVFDTSGENPLEGTDNFIFPKLEGLAAAAAILPTLQNFLLTFAATRVENVGSARRSTKITGEK